MTDSSSTVYNLVLSLHIVGALGVAAAYTIDTAGLIGLRRSTVGEEARAWLVTRRWVLIIGPASIGLVLVTGLYMTVVQFGAIPWILVSLGSLVAIAVTGGLLTGIPMAGVTPGIEGTVGPLSEEVRRGLRSPALTISVATRITITIGIVFLMALKPDLPTSLLVIGLAAAIGVGAGLAYGGRGPVRATP
jgi:hypothetical protein